jgi:3-hydroxyacyl-CoA dehydrogenase
MTAEYKVDGAIAVITLNNPPVNGLGLATRRGMVEVAPGAGGCAVKAIVITGAGKAFSGGADITEFGKEDAYREPHLISVIQQLDLSTKPVIAAIHSVCMGGGLELALGCHYRIAAPARPWRCPRSSWACCPAPAARSACRACWVWKPR